MFKGADSDDPMWPYMVVASTPYGGRVAWRWLNRSTGEVGTWEDTRYAAVVAIEMRRETATMEYQSPISGFSVLALRNRVWAEGGATMHAVSGRSPSSGYVTAFAKCHEQRIPKVLAHHYFDSLVSQYMMHYGKNLSESGTYLGLWLNARFLHLDLVRVYSSKEQALAVAKNAKQECIWDVENKESIRVDQ